MASEMTNEQLSAAYAGAAQARSGPRGPSCPSVEALAAAVQNERSETQLLETLNHALRCPA